MEKLTLNGIEKLHNYKKKGGINVQILEIFPNKNNNEKLLNNNI